ncbi:hypothetical protein B0I73DRAFT_162585 [Yarrowia lipolytica]|uniref:Uncharacterized protein n=1 Tax=Yarrowia lipolytica TaxID=4952 RepID=A0A371C507_YARLL|nr:hypothetical protein BKA91DRAFT_161080 [Yarrowia lipolytica]KAE8174252.1 hypothetical protein BKA90DRAFT_158873 [Yarrowia lipolytica]KAJ8055623.1 hypothetical protein LXG23DRAFT_35268 [Yarrowia lipolytica]RDW25409.1 hypothetical protein B0I71DRAFT_171106 [Yarrowia lipolytica]RDW37851.1 hypothetical protein B0I73DRAFT_162585 [Yarrowia lipolytica]
MPLEHWLVTTGVLQASQYTIARTVTNAEVAKLLWYNASDVLGNSFDQEDEGYDFDVSIATFPDPWLWKLSRSALQRVWLCYLRGPERTRYDPGLDASTLQPYVSPGDSQRSYYAVKYSRRSEVLTTFNTALNHCTRPEDVHSFDNLQEAAYFLKRRPKFFKTTQRQHLNIGGRPVFKVFSDGSS